MQKKSLAEVRIQNLIAIYRFVLQKRYCTKREIQQSTFLSWGSISNGVRELTEMGILAAEEKGTASSRGRYADTVFVDDKRVLVIGIDVLRSGIHGALLNLKAEAVYEETGREIQDTKRESFLNKIFLTIDRLQVEAKKRNAVVMAIGCSISGIVDSQKGISRYLSGFAEKEWVDVPLADLLRQRYQIPVFLEHDPQCVLYHEMEKWGKDDAVLIRMGQGLGFAVCLDGHIYAGEGRYELSFFRVNGPKGPIPMEDVASLWGASMKKHPSVDAEYILEHFADYQADYEWLGKGLGEAIFNLYCLFHNRNVFLTGPLSAKKECYFDSMRKTIDEYANYPLSQTLNFIVDSADDAASGAAMIAIERSLPVFLKKENK